MGYWEGRRAMADDTLDVMEGTGVSNTMQEQMSKSRLKLKEFMTASNTPEVLESIQVNDYIEGVEEYGSSYKVITGWVDNISIWNGEYRFNIQADDNWNGARGTTIFSEFGKINKLEPKERIVTAYQKTLS